MEDSGNASTRSWAALILGYGILVLGFGGASGIWVPSVMPNKTVGIDALTTYVMATLAPLIVDMVLQPDDFKSELTSLYKTGVLLVAAIASICAFIALLREAEDPSWATWLAGWLGVVLTIVVWFLLAARQKRFESSPTGSKSGSLGRREVTQGGLNGRGL